MCHFYSINTSSIRTKTLQFLTVNFSVKYTDVVVAPPFLYLDQVKSSLTDRIEISGQNSWVGKGGAFTGEIRLVCLGCNPY